MASMFGIRSGFFRKSAAALGAPQVSETAQSLAKRLAIPGLDIQENSFRRFDDGASFSGHFPGAVVDVTMGATYLEGFGPSDKPLLMMSGLSREPELLARLVSHLDSKGIQVASALPAVDVEVLGFDRQVVTLRPDLGQEAVLYAKNPKWEEGAPITFVGPTTPLAVADHLDLAMGAIGATANSLSARDLPRVLRRADVESATGIPEPVRALILGKFHATGTVMRLQEAFLAPIQVAADGLGHVLGSLSSPTMQSLEQAFETAPMKADTREDAERLLRVLKGTAVTELLEARVNAGHRVSRSGAGWGTK